MKSILKETIYLKSKRNTSDKATSKWIGGLSDDRTFLSKLFGKEATVVPESELILDEYGQIRYKVGVPKDLSQFLVNPPFDTCVSINIKKSSFVAVLLHQLQRPKTVINTIIHSKELQNNDGESVLQYLFSKDSSYPSAWAEDLKDHLQCILLKGVVTFRTTTISQEKVISYQDIINYAFSNHLYDVLISLSCLPHRNMIYNYETRTITLWLPQSEVKSVEEIVSKSKLLTALSILK